MKRISIFFYALFLSALTVGNASHCKNSSCLKSNLLVGSQAPNFNAQAAIQDDIFDFSLQDYRGKYVVLVFYPLDFTFVCPTELHAFQERAQEFNDRNAKVVACSVDSVYTHLAWLNTPRSDGGVQGVEYPLVSDLDKSISARYQVLDEEKGIAFRGLFVIDGEGVVRHQLVNDLPIGRNVDDVLRFLDALAAFEAEGQVCPANWTLGEKTLKPTSDGLIEYLSETK
jgi:peroxiredoxin (alkyl hydroperoxide reductase subunit C)